MVKRKRYTGEIKQMVIEDIRDNNFSYAAAQRKYNIADSVLIRWDRIYLEEGVEGLYKQHCGRKKDSKSKELKKQSNNQTKEDLLVENQKLRMEIEYLKKLNALIQKKELSAKEIKHK